MSDNIPDEASAAPTEPLPVVETAEQAPPVAVAYAPAPQAAPSKTPAEIAASNKHAATIAGGVILAVVLALFIFASGVAVGSHMGGPRSGFAGPRGAQMQRGQGFPGQGMMPDGGQQRGMRGGRGHRGGPGGFNGQAPLGAPDDGQNGSAPTAPQAAPQAPPTAPGQGQ
jgi:hypothetical protein